MSNNKTKNKEKINWDRIENKIKKELKDKENSKPFLNIDGNVFYKNEFSEFSALLLEQEMLTLFSRGECITTSWDTSNGILWFLIKNITH